MKFSIKKYSLISLIFPLQLLSMEQLSETQRQFPITGSISDLEMSSLINTFSAFTQKNAAWLINYEKRLLQDPFLPSRIAEQQTVSANSTIITNTIRSSPIIASSKETQRFQTKAPQLSGQDFKPSANVTGQVSKKQKTTTQYDKQPITAFYIAKTREEELNERARKDQEEAERERESKETFDTLIKKYKNYSHQQILQDLSKKLSSNFYLLTTMIQVYKHFDISNETFESTHVDADQNTIMHIAAKYSRSKLLEYFHDQKIKMNITNRNRKTPSQLARKDSYVAHYLKQLEKE